MVTEYVPTENWNDNQKWTDAIMQAFSDTLTAYLNDTLLLGVQTESPTIGAVVATTTTTNDSLKITGKASGALSTNAVDIELPSDNLQGRYETFSLSSDITLKITGAHWGIGGTGNLTGAILEFGFINDGSATPALAIYYHGGRDTISSTLCKTTQTDVTTPSLVLVNRTILSGTWPIKTFGYCRADFNDTGDVWAIQTGLDDIVVGKEAIGVWQPHTQVPGGYSANPTFLQSSFCRYGKTIFYKLRTNAAGTSNNTSSTYSLPIAAVNAEDGITTVVYDNNSLQTSPGLFRTQAGSTTALVYKTMAAGAWTGSGDKYVDFNVHYEIA